MYKRFSQIRTIFNFLLENKPHWKYNVPMNPPNFRLLVGLSVHFLFVWAYKSQTQICMYVCVHVGVILCLCLTIMLNIRIMACLFLCMLCRQMITNVFAQLRICCVRVCYVPLDMVVLCFTLICVYLCMCVIARVFVCVVCSE